MSGHCGESTSERIAREREEVVTTSPAVDLVALSCRRWIKPQGWATRAIAISLAERDALISELTELRASRSLMEEAVRALEPFARVANSSGFAIGRPVERVTDEDFRRAQSALATIKEKTT